jgi:hypothetical protein
LEFVLVLAALIGLIFGGLSLTYGFLASAITATAARDAARTLSIECGEGSPTAYQDAQGAARLDLESGLLVVDGTPTTAALSSPAPGEWYFYGSCSSSEATAEVVYDAPSLFPAVMASTGAKHPNTFVEESEVSFPVE